MSSTASNRFHEPRPDIRQGPAAFLASSRLFGGLGSDALGRIVRNARKIHLGRGKPIYRSGEPCQNFYVVGYGVAALSVHAEPDREKILELRGAGECIGEENMLAEQPHAITASMLTDGMLVCVPRQAVLETLEHHPKLAQEIIADLSRRTLHLVRQIESKSNRSGTERVVGYLMQASGRTDPFVQDVNLSVPKCIVASLLDLTKESFSRVLRDLTERGLIEVQGRSIRLLDPSRLAQLCHRGRGCAQCGGCARGGAWVD